MYSYVTNVAKPKDRAHRLARQDGMELLGYIVGTSLSPFIYEKLGGFGSYGISAGMTFLAIIYFIFFVKEPIVPKTDESLGIGDSTSNWFVKALVTPLKGMKSLIVKKRKPFLKFLILLQFFCFLIYWVVIEAAMINYLYMFQVLKTALVHLVFDPKRYFRGSKSCKAAVPVNFCNDKNPQESLAVLYFI